MTLPQWILIGVIFVPLAFVIASRLRIDLAALLMAVMLGIFQLFGFGMLGPAYTPAAAGNIVSGFGQPVILILISLFFLTHALEKSGITRWLAQKLVRWGGNNQSYLIALFAGITALFSLFMNNLAAGALVLPIAMEAARRTRISPSKLLIPVAYGSLLGGAATYFTTANIIVSNLLTNADPPQASLHILDFTPVGSLIAIAGVLFFGFFGKRLLPDRKPSVEQSLARLSGNELEELYALGNRLWAGRIAPSSPLVNQTLKLSGIGETLGVVIVAMRRHNERSFSVPALTDVLHPNDILLIVGREERVFKLAEKGVRLRPEKNTLTTYGLTLTELTPTPRSSAIGRTLKDINFRSQYGFAALALLRGQRSFRTDVADLPIKPGDSLLIVGPPHRIPDLHHGADFIIFEPNLSDLPVDGKMAIFAVALVAGAIVAIILGVPVELAMLSAAVLYFLLGRVSMEEGYRIVEWQAVFLIAGMYVVSDAMVETHLADLLGTGLLNIVEPFGALGVAAGAYVLSAVLTQIMGGQVTALVTGPVTISAAIHLGISPQAIAVATAIGCSASFFTPLAHPVNIMMIAPGNYTFGDFFRSGWPLTILSFLMLMLGMILFWRL